MDQGQELIKLALFGQPIKSSLSPFIQRMFAAQFGLNIEFQLIETGAGGFPQALEKFRRHGGVGCNVTLPLKHDAWQLANGASPAVSQAQAANTLVYQPATGWFAHNTDGAGLIADLVGHHGIGLAGQRLLLLGAGGAAAGVLGPLLQEGPREVVLVNRNLERAQMLAARFNDGGKISVTNWAGLRTLGSFNVIINATSLGHHGEAPPLTASVFAPDAVCYDLNYYKASLPLKSLCEDLGCAYFDGLGMLVGQAAKSFFIWTGKRPDSSLVTEACRTHQPTD